MACTVADLSGHRVAVLAQTPTPQDLCEDIRVMATTAVPEGSRVRVHAARRGHRGRRARSAGTIR